MADNALQSALEWMRSPKRTQQVQGLGNTLAEAIDNLSKARATDEALWQKTFQDPRNPLKVTNPQGLQELTQRTMAGPMGFAPVGMVVMRGVTPEAIARANQLANVNASPGYILQETGLVKVPTKEGTTWGRQISDAPIQVDFDKLKTTPYEGMYFREPLKVGDVVSHPELFDLYPELKNIGLFKTADNNAYYSSAMQGEMGIPSGEFVKQYFKDPEKQFNNIRAMAVHELGHAVQNLDRMPRGGTAQEFMGKAYKNVKERADSTINSLEEATKNFLEGQGLTPPKDFKSFVQSVSYIKTNGPKYLEDVGPESRKRIEAVLSSDISNDLLDTFSRVEQAYGKIKTKEKKAFKQYQNLAGEAQSRAMEKQYLENNYNAPVTSFYDVPVESLIYRDPFGNPLR